MDEIEATRRWSQAKVGASTEWFWAGELLRLDEGTRSRAAARAERIGLDHVALIDAPPGVVLMALGATSRILVVVDDVEAVLALLPPEMARVHAQRLAARPESWELVQVDVEGAGTDGAKGIGGGLSKAIITLVDLVAHFLTSTAQYPRRAGWLSGR